MISEEDKVFCKDMARKICVNKGYRNWVRAQYLDANCEWKNTCLELLKYDCEIPNAIGSDDKLKAAFLYNCFRGTSFDATGELIFMFCLKGTSWHTIITCIPSSEEFEAISNDLKKHR